MECIGSPYSMQRSSSREVGKLMDYPYSLDAIASHLRDLSKELSKLLDISHDDAWEMCIQKLDDKFLTMDKETNDSMS